MKVKFIEFYQGHKTYPHAYYPGDVAEVEDSVGRELVFMGKAEEVKEARPAPKSKAKNKEAGSEE